MVKMILLNGRYLIPQAIADLVCEGLSKNLGLNSSDSSDSSGSTSYVDYAAQLGFLFQTTADSNNFNYLLNCQKTYSTSRLSEYDLRYCYCFKFNHQALSDLSADNTYWISPCFVLASDNNIQISANPYNNELMKISSPEGTDAFILGMCHDSSDVTSASLYIYPDSNWFYNVCASDFSYYVVERQEATDYSYLSYEDNVATIDTAWAAEGTSVTDDRLGNDAVPVLPLSVYDSSWSAATSNKSTILSGSFVDAETETVTDSVADSTTDTTTDATTKTDFWSSVLSWLDKILQAIKALVSGITTPIVNAIADVKTTVLSIPSYLQSLVSFFTGTMTIESPLAAIQFGALFDLFPFNIPYGIYKAISFWDAGASPPIITIPLPTYNGGGVDIYKFEIDFSKIPGMSVLVSLIRSGELILFAVGLLMITRKVTKW